jgi:hypothetical protein
MSITLATLTRRLIRFNAGTVPRAVREEIEKPLPVIRTKVKASARSKLPKSGGLAEWGAAAHLTAQVHLLGDTVHAKIKVHRSSLHGASDLRALDRGRVRHPAWGRRRSRDWYIQSVPPRTYSEPIAGSREWRRAVERACDEAADVIRHGR